MDGESFFVYEENMILNIDASDKDSDDKIFSLNLTSKVNYFYKRGYPLDFLALFVVLFVIVDDY